MISTLLDDFEVFYTSIAKVTEAVGETVRILVLEQEFEDISELLQSQVLLECMKILFLYVSKKKWFLEMNLLLVKML